MFNFSHHLVFFIKVVQKNQPMTSYLMLSLMSEKMLLKFELQLLYMAASSTVYILTFNDKFVSSLFLEINFLVSVHLSCVFIIGF